MIRILLDRAFDNERHYIHAVGLSTDTKPNTGIITGSKFIAVDTGAGYLFDETAGEWHENTQLSEAVAAYLDDHPEALDQAAIEAMFGDQLDGIEEDIGGLKSALNSSMETIRSNSLEQYLYKKNTYFNSSFVETALNGYDTYKIPVEKVSFAFEKWSGETTPVNELNNSYHYTCENGSGVFSRELSGADVRTDYSNKFIAFIVPNDCKFLYLTIYAAVVPDLSFYADYPYPGFADKDIHRNLALTVNEHSAVKTIAYMNRAGTSIEVLAGMSSYWLPVKSGDKAKITTNSITGLAFVAELIDKTARTVTLYGPSYDQSLEPTFLNDGILVVLEDDAHAGNVTFYPVSRCDAYEKQIETLGQSVGALQQSTETLEQDVDNIQNKLEASSVDYTTGAISGKYCRLVSGSTTEIEIRNGSGYSYSKVDVQDWMYEVDFNILSSTGITSNSIYCGFTDENNLLISKNPEVSVGQYKLIVPSNAKYILLNFFGSTYCAGYTIKSDTFAKNSQIEQLQTEITNLFDGLTGVAFGTSLTYKAQTTGGYLQYLPDLSGITFDNQGIGSSFIYGNMLTAIKAYTGYAGKRVCLLEGFVNDWYNNKTLGTWKDNAETSVCGCVRSALNYMISQNANLTIFLILDHYGKNYGNVDCSTIAVNGAGLTQFEYYEEIAKVAESLGIPVIKEYAGSQISENTPQYLLDNIHPTALGAKQSANCIWSRMKTYLPNAVS